jgi:predicted nucleotidyltransferase
MRKCPIQQVSKKAEEVGIPFIVIGGYAVYAHGYTRTTDDLDLIVPHELRAEWSKLLDGFGMVVKNDAATFLQFDSKNEAEMAVDLMFVSEAVFDRLNQTAVDAKVEGVDVKVVALLHLIALKCHSFQHSRSMRRLKDMDDLVQLILVNHLDLNEPELRATILKHGSADIYEKLQHACANE